jgi:hypothetical protein
MHQFLRNAFQALGFDNYGVNQEGCSHASHRKRHARWVRKVFERQQLARHSE